MSNNVMNDFNTKFKIEKLLIYETEFWVWSLRPIQATLGSGVLSLKRECPVFSEVKDEEFLDLNIIIKIIEKTLMKTFKYDIMNYLMLMMVDNQVHYHVIPRYRRVVNFKELSWIDSGWPGIPIITGEEKEVMVLKEILSTVKDNLIVL